MLTYMSEGGKVVEIKKELDKLTQLSASLTEEQKTKIANFNKNKTRI